MHVTGFTAKVSARLGRSPVSGPPQDAARGSRSSSRTSCKVVVQSHSQQQQDVEDDFTPGMCDALLREDVEAGREVGLNGCSAPAGKNYIFQGCLTRGLELKPPSWEDAPARTAPGIQPSLNQFGDFILVFSYASTIRDRANKGWSGRAGRDAGLVLPYMHPSSSPGARWGPGCSSWEATEIWCLQLGWAW